MWGRPSFVVLLAVAAAIVIAAISIAAHPQSPVVAISNAPH
jgi:hypothetical protein